MSAALLVALVTASYSRDLNCIDAFAGVRICPPEKAAFVGSDGAGYYRFEDGWQSITISVAAGTGHGGNPEAYSRNDTFLVENITIEDRIVHGEIRHTIRDTAVFEAASSREDGMAYYDVEIVGSGDTALVSLVDFEGAEAGRAGFGDLAEHVSRLRAGTTIDGIPVGEVDPAGGFE